VADWPALHPALVVDASAGDVGQQFELFEVFEALHHGQRICNPMSEAELGHLVELLALPNKPDLASIRDAASMVDIGCGSGELLLRCHEAGIGDDWFGCDLSPWMLNDACRQAEQRAPGSGTWVLGHGARWSSPQALRLSCIGAEWVFHGMNGAVAALGSMCVPGGRVAFGGPRLHFDADPGVVTESHGRLDTVAEVESTLRANGLRLVERIDPDEDGWRSYLARSHECVRTWRNMYPGPKADRFLEDQRDWAERFEAEAQIIGWSVWVAVRM